MILCEAHSCFTALPHFPSPLDAVLNQHMIIQNRFYDDQIEINHSCFACRANGIAEQI